MSSWPPKKLDICGCIPSELSFCLTAFLFFLLPAFFWRFYTMFGGCLVNVIIFWFWVGATSTSLTSSTCWENDCVDSSTLFECVDSCTTLYVWASSLSTLQDSSEEESESLDNDDVHSFRLCPSLSQVVQHQSFMHADCLFPICKDLLHLKSWFGRILLDIVDLEIN